MAIEKSIIRLCKDQLGSTAIEYGVLAALISVAILTFSSTSLTSLFNNVGTALSRLEGGLNDGVDSVGGKGVGAGELSSEEFADCAGKSGQNGKGNNCNKNNNSGSKK